MSRKYNVRLKWFFLIIIIQLVIILLVPFLIGNNKMILKTYNRIEINIIETSKNIVIEGNEEIKKFEKYTSSINFKPSFDKNEYDYIISFYNNSSYVTTLFYDSTRETFKINMGIFFTDSISQKSINPQFDDLIQKYLEQLSITHRL